MDKISVIIPVYNVEQYIKKCLDSIIMQSYKNLEIILIDDGSTDNSGKICDEYLNNDSRIEVIHQENKGLSAARNIGIKKSTGKYIAFIDSDDYITTDYVEVLYNKLIENDADISICLDCWIYKNKIKYVHKNSNNIYNYDSKSAIDVMNGMHSFGCSAWGKLYKKRLFDNIVFPIGKICEDAYIMYKIFDLAQKIVFYDKALYCYRQRQDSISKNNNISLDPICASQECLKFIENKYPDIICSALIHVTYSDLAVYNKILLSGQKEKYSSVINEIIARLKENKKIIKHNISKEKYMQIICLVKCRYLYDEIFLTIRKIKAKDRMQW